MNIEKEHPINKIMQESLSKIKNIIDVDTVIGSPILTVDGQTIIPITKVSVGFVAGGGEYSQNIPCKKQKDAYPFAGGSGAGFNISPIGFLMGKGDNLKFISIDNKSSVENILKIIANLTKKIADK